MKFIYISIYEIFQHFTILNKSQYFNKHLLLVTQEEYLQMEQRTLIGK